MQTRRQFLTAASVVVPPLLTATSKAVAQAYPNRPIRWIVPSPAGSPVDSIARKLGESVGKQLGTTILIENKPGAVGSIGAAEVVRSAADGYTFLFSTGGPVIDALAVIRALPYDPKRDLSFISKVAANGPVLVAHPSVKSNSLSEWIASLKSSGESAAYGSWGPGTLPAQVMETLARQAGIKLNEVPYKGSPPALQDLLGNQIGMTFTGPNVAAPLLAEGKLKALAVVGPKRSPLLPNTPTFAESGFKGFVFTNEIWVGLIASSKVDGKIAQSTAAAVQAAVRDPALQRFLSEAGFTAIGNTSADFTREYEAEAAVVPDLIRSLGVVPQ